MNGTASDFLRHLMLIQLDVLVHFTFSIHKVKHRFGTRLDWHITEGYAGSQVLLRASLQYLIAQLVVFPTREKPPTPQQ